jgi:hypothetical protein
MCTSSTLEVYSHLLAMPLFVRQFMRIIFGFLFPLLVSVQQHSYAGFHSFEILS